MAVSVEEYTGSPSFAGERDKASGTRRVRLAWGSIDAYYTELFPAAVGGIPQLPALMPGSLYLRAKSVAFKPEFDEALIASYGPPNAYDYAVAVVQYETLPYGQDDPDSDQIITYRVSFDAQMYEMKNTGLKWKGTNTPIDNPDFHAAKLVNTIDHELTFHRVVTVPWATLRSLFGKVNNGAFYGAAADTLLLGGVEIQQTLSLDGTIASQVTIVFKEKNIDGNATYGWNHMFDPDDGKWKEVETEDDKPLYPSGDFDGLL